MQVVGTLEDSRGYIWAATKGGLSKFNGERFENFNRDDGLKIQSNFGQLTEDYKGNIWLRYTNYGFAKFDGQNFTNYVYQDANLSNIVEYKNTMVFMRNDSLFQLLDEKAIFMGITKNSKDNYLKNNPTENILYLYCDGDGIYYLDEKSKKFLPIIKVGMVNLRLHKFNQEILICIDNKNELVYYRLKNKQLTKYFSLSASRQHFDNYPDFSFVFPFKSQTFLYDKDARKIIKLSDDISQLEYEINHKNNTSKCYFGTENGLKCVFLNGFKYFTQQEVPYAWGVTEDHQKNIWITNFNYSLQKYANNKLGTITGYERVITKKLSTKHPNFSMNNWYYHPLKDKFNKLWLPKIEGALIVENDKFDFFTPKEPKSAPFFNIAEDKQRNKIIGCSYGGITIIENKPPYKYAFVSDTTPMFHTPRFILTAAVDTLGNYWLGGRLGIVRYNPDKKTFKYYNQANQKARQKGIANFTFDSHGGLWAGTFDEGLAKYNPKTDSFDPIFEQYFRNKCSTFMGQISEHYFMIGDFLNLYIIDLDALYKEKKEVVVKVLNFHNGFMGLEPGQNGLFKDSNGKIWITSGTVLSVLDPKLLNLESATLNTYIRRINGMKLPFKYENLPSIELEYDKNEVKIEVESVGEDKSANSQFSYRIKGFQETWSKWQEDKAIYLTNMPLGNYTIEIRSKRGKIDDKHPLTSLKFSINIPFYKSPNFYKYAFLIFLILIGLLGAFLYRTYRQSIKDKEQNKRKLEQDRKLKFLQIQTTQAQLNPHFIFNVLATLQSQIRHNPDGASENIAKLSHLIRSFLNANMFDSKTILSVIKLEIGLDKEISLLRSYIEFEKIQKDNFDYEIIETPPIDAINYKIQPMLIQPFVENSIKHGFNELVNKRGKLLIQFFEEEDSLICVIDDNGIGRANARKLQDGSLKKYKSLGTDLVFNRIEVLKNVGYLINISVEDKPENGTKVTISIRFEGEYNGKN